MKDNFSEGIESNGTDQKSWSGTEIENQVGIVTEEIVVTEAGIMIVGVAGIGIDTMTEIVVMTGKGSEIPIILVAMTQEIAVDHVHDQGSDQGIMIAAGVALDHFCQISFPLIVEEVNDCLYGMD